MGGAACRGLGSVVRRPAYRRWRGGRALVLAVWWAVAAAGSWSELIVPAPGGLGRLRPVGHTRRPRGLSGYFLWEHLCASLWRILRGVAGRS